MMTFTLTEAESRKAYRKLKLKIGKHEAAYGNVGNSYVAFPEYRGLGYDHESQMCFVSVSVTALGQTQVSRVTLPRFYAGGMPPYSEWCEMLEQVLVIT